MHKTKNALFAALAAASLALCSLTSHAAEDKAATKKEPSAKQVQQQERMKGCNADAKAKDLKGDERKAFMKECLSAHKQEQQQDKMKSCNAEAKTQDLKGDARKAFMKNCLSAQPAA